MERLFKPYDKEYMRMAMLKHEETFKQQVCELHRVYQIQKILMKNIGMGSEQIDHMKKIPKSLEIDLERPVGDDIAEASEVELTLGVGLGHNRRKSSDCGPNSVSSSSTRSSRGTHSVYQVEGEGEQLRSEKLNQPSWLFQVLSLNMTSPY